MVQTLFGAKAKPFLKWAGGKSQLLAEIDKRLPKEAFESGGIDTYIEPFVGGGAVFFHVVQKYPQIQKFYLFDINRDLVNCYNAVKSDVHVLIRQVKTIERRFLRLEGQERATEYYRMRDRFNQDRAAAKLIFLNKTCYNGLYRVNKSNEFNVPFGDYKRPTICDEDNLKAVSCLLKRANVECHDFEACSEYLDERAFVYFDPPYRPLSATAGFTSYSKDRFSEEEQIRLAEFCHHVTDKGAKFLLSNSDPKNEDPRDHFFEDNYRDFHLQRVKAIRAINCKGAGRGQINELLITNY
ncbi:MAG: DNA adenine methylase [Planctomycetota bacterium]|jgi:DNA adenine methylase